MRDELRSGPLTVVAIDPGGTTGIATYTADVMRFGNRLPEFYNETWNQLELGPQKHHWDLYNLLCMNRTGQTRVVCESFQNRGIDKELISCELVGVVELFNQETISLPSFWQAQVVWWQTSSVINSKENSFWSDIKLKRIGKYTPGLKHANDAMAHLLHHLTFTMDRRDIFELLKG